MIPATKLSRWLLVLAVPIWHILLTTTAQALNGPQFIGFSAESTALAGSGHVAVADTSAINTNPAALSLIQGTRLDVTAGFIQAFLHHSDVFGNDNVAGQNNVYAIGNLGVATRLSSVPGLTIGAGIFTQGGFGSDFRNLMTALELRTLGPPFFDISSLRLGLATKSPTSCPLALPPAWDIPMSPYACFQGRLYSLHLAYLTDSPASTFETVVRATPASVLWAAIALRMWCLQ